MRNYRYRYFSKGQCATIYTRDNHTCVYCGKPATVIDHIVSYELGGKTEISNGVSCCKSCNKFKENDSQGKYIALGMAHIARIKVRGKKKHGK